MMMVVMLRLVYHLLAVESIVIQFMQLHAIMMDQLLGIRIRCLGEARGSIYVVWIIPTVALREVTRDVRFQHAWCR